MKLYINKEELLQPLIKVASIVERKQTIPILANVLITATEDNLQLLCTDLEVESRIRISSKHYHEAYGSCTVDAKKLLDIVKALPDDSPILLQQNNDRLQLTSGRSKFSLQTRPPEDFPLTEDNDWDFQTTVQQPQLKKLIELCVFTMAHHDVRYYLNGMLFRFQPGQLITVATDGHRLGKAYIINKNITRSWDLVMPRKAVLEMSRLLGYQDEPVELQSNKHHFRLNIGSLSFISKLIDAKYPDYSTLIPTNLDKTIIVNRERFIEAASRSAILCSDKTPGVHLQVTNNQLTLVVSTVEQEQATEELAVRYDGPAFEVGYNVMYLIEAAKSIENEEIRFQIGTIDAGCVISSPQALDHVGGCQYLVMPIRI